MKAETKTKDTPESSQVQQLKYYPATETLVVIYKPKGDEYEYYNVPAKFKAVTGPLDHVVSHQGR